MLAYNTFEKTKEIEESLQQTNSSQDTIDNKTQKKCIVLSHSLIEKCVSLFRRRRSHRNAIDFDKKYLKNKLLKNIIDGMSFVSKT